ncbi:hypothetical protein D0469_12805 [Peribacillus saganii]|uniref:Uncharacterized protein n=1 Tax=Peribacillus saganii TaxID=2303992 RepID=A0A372LN61_9BACI|nr:hypothetical protein [Peribacillus saganii]RFU68141.1 hypothetical protein D0469_12805 [Peribacillus saganii]
MGSKVNMLNATKYVGGAVFLLGIAIFLYGFFVSDYSAVTGIGIGTIMGSVFIFLMGMFFIATEEMLEKRYKGIKLSPINNRKLTE